MPSAIARDELARRLREGSVLVVEALSPDFFADGHLPGAINLPITTTNDVLELLASATASPIVVYGTRTGQEAAELARRIEAAGSRSVLIYEDGKEDWVEAGLEIDRP